MEFKNIMFIAVLLCSGWAILVSGLTSINDLGTTITTTSELTQSNSEEEEPRSYFDGIPVPKQSDSTKSNFGESPLGDEFSGIIDVLNLGIPLAFVAVIMLVLTYKHNPIGITGLALSICLVFVSANRANRAAEIVQQKTEFSIDARVWWK